MDDSFFHIWQTVGILLTFISSLATIIVSCVSLHVTKKTAEKKTLFDESERWSLIFREKCSEFLTICGNIQKTYSPQIDDSHENTIQSLCLKRYEILLLLPPNEYIELENTLHNINVLAIEHFKSLKSTYFAMEKSESEYIEQQNISTQKGEEIFNMLVKLESLMRDILQSEVENRTRLVYVKGKKFL